MGRAEKRRCLSCGETFTPEPRNARHQRYCGEAPCKAASKRPVRVREDFDPRLERVGERHFGGSDAGAGEAPH